MLFYCDLLFQGFSFTVACLLFVTIITIPDPSSQRRIPRQIKGSGCVKSWRMRDSGVEAVCEKVSYQCLCNVFHYGYPKCDPVYERRTYNVVRGNRTITLTKRVTVNCVCAHCQDWLTRQLKLLLQEHACTNNVSFMFTFRTECGKRDIFPRFVFSLGTFSNHDGDVEIWQRRLKSEFISADKSLISLNKAILTLYKIISNDLANFPKMYG